MRTMRKLKRALLAVVLVGALAASAAADKACPDEADSSGAADAAPKVEVIRGPNGEQIIRIKQAFCIEGRIQKPNVFYVLDRTAIGYEWQRLTQDFMPRILKSVERAPF